MNFHDLKKILELTGDRALEANWHRHSNGGSWVENCSFVDETAFVGEDAIVHGENTEVRDGARILGSQVCDGARVSPYPGDVPKSRFGDPHGLYQTVVRDGKEIWVNANGRVPCLGGLASSPVVRNGSIISGKGTMIFDGADVSGSEVSDGAQIHGDGTWVSGSRVSGNGTEIRGGARVTGSEVRDGVQVYGKGDEFCKYTEVDGAVIYGVGTEVRHGAHVYKGAQVGDGAIVEGSGTEVFGIVTGKGTKVSHRSHVFKGSTVRDGAHVFGGDVVHDAVVEGKDTYVGEGGMATGIGTFIYGGAQIYDGAQVGDHDQSEGIEIGGGAVIRGDYTKVQAGVRINQPIVVSSGTVTDDRYFTPPGRSRSATTPSWAASNSAAVLGQTCSNKREPNQCAF